MEATTGRQTRSAVIACVALGLCLTFGSCKGDWRDGWSIELSRTIPLPSYAVGAVWSPDGKRLASMQQFGDQISVWTTDGALVTTFSRHEGGGPQGGQCLAFMPDGVTLLAPAPTDTPEHRKSAFGLWDAETGALKRLIPGPNPDSDDTRLPLDNSAGICVLSPDGAFVAMRPRYIASLVAVYSTRDWAILGTRQLWQRDVPVRWSNKHPWPGLKNSPSALAFGADNALSVGASEAIITFRMPFGSSEPTYLVGIPPGDLEVVGPAPKTIEFWALIFRPIRYNPAGDRLAIGLHVLNRDNDVEQAKKSGDVERLRKLASLKIWDVRAQRIVAQDPLSDDLPWDADWNHDGTLLAVVTQNHFLKIYRPSDANGTPILQVKMDAGSESVRFSPATDQVAVAPGNTVQIYSISKR